MSVKPVRAPWLSQLASDGQWNAGSLWSWAVRFTWLATRSSRETAKELARVRLAQRGLLIADFPCRASFTAHTHHSAKCLAVNGPARGSKGRPPIPTVLLTALSLLAVTAAELSLQWLCELQGLEIHLEREDGTLPITSILLCRWTVT